MKYWNWIDIGIEKNEIFDSLQLRFFVFYIANFYLL